MRFPTILGISSSEPAAFQDRIRDRYPLYQRESAANFPEEIRGLLTQLPIGALPQRERHIFATADSARSISLTADFLAVSETKYEQWENFGPEISTAIAALREIYHPAFFTRIGLRYRDSIDKAEIPGMEDAQWDRLLNPKLTGLLASDEFRADVEAQESTVVMSLPEIQGAKVQIRHGLRSVTDQPTRKLYVFDADFSLMQRTEVGDVDQILSTFHIASGNLFRWAITRELYQALEPREI